MAAPVAIAVRPIDLALPDSRSRSSSFNFHTFSSDMLSPIDARYLSASPSRSPLRDDDSLAIALRRALSASPIHNSKIHVFPPKTDAYESTSGTATIVPPTRVQTPISQSPTQNAVPTMNIEVVPATTAPSGQRRTAARRGRSKSRRKINLTRLNLNNLDPNVVPWRGSTVVSSSLPPPPRVPSSAKRASQASGIQLQHQRKDGSARRLSARPTRYEPYPIDSNHCFAPPRRRLPIVGIDACKQWVSAPKPPRSWFETTPREEQEAGIREDIIAIENGREQKENLEKIVQRVLDEANLALDCVTAEQSALLLHTSCTLSFADLDGYEEMLVLEEKTDELRSCIERLEALLDEVKMDQKLKRTGPDDGGYYNEASGDAFLWNGHLEQVQEDLKKAAQRQGSRSASCTFSTAPRLFVEAYVYRRVKECFDSSRWWKSFDPFTREKYDSFFRSREEVLYISSLFEEIAAYGECLFPWEHAEAIKDDFYELTGVYLQSSVNGQQNDTKIISTKIIDRLWSTMLAKEEGKGANLDIVLGDCGLELFRDLAYADFLLQNGLASRVCLHGKRMPYGALEATRGDFEWLLDSLSDRRRFPVASHNYAKLLQKRLYDYRSAGKLVFEDHPFWSTGYTFWELPIQAPDLFRRLSRLHSRLILFKGELNHRKLTYDDDRLSASNSSVLFDKAIGPLGSYGRIIGRAEFEMPLVVSYGFGYASGHVDISNGRPGE
ncbi:hypothetical protein FRC17_003143 [Serendipita sp. 399]|nr:hypothetical protein FRC17_003143 [Serendipita sp. 399]